MQPPGAQQLGPEIFLARARRTSRAEYHRIAELGFFRGERVELIRGIVVRMPPIGPPHSELVDRLTERFVRGCGDRARVRIQQPFLAADDSEPEPDVAVVARGSYASSHPSEALLLIEVAETSLAYDRKTKAALYAESGVPEYWIVDVNGQAVDVLTDPADGAYREQRRVVAGEIAPSAFPDVLISVNALFEP